MKIKAIVLIAVSAIITLSFTFASVQTSDKPSKSEVKADLSEAPAGGIAIDNK